MQRVDALGRVGLGVLRYGLVMFLGAALVAAAEALGSAGAEPAVAREVVVA